MADIERYICDNNRMNENEILLDNIESVNLKDIRHNKLIILNGILFYRKFFKNCIVHQCNETPRANEQNEPQ